MLINKNKNFEIKYQNKENQNYISNNIDNTKDNNIKNDNDNNNKIYSKEELKNIKNLTKLLNDNNPSLYQQLENFEFLDSGGESNVYNVTIKESKIKT